MDVANRIEELKAQGYSQPIAENLAWQEWQQTPAAQAAPASEQEIGSADKTQFDAARRDAGGAPVAGVDEAEHETALYLANNGGLKPGEVVKVLAPGEMLGAVGEVDGFDGAGHPVVYVSGIVNGRPVHGYFVYPVIELEKY